MPYMVELVIGDADLADEMARMRVWLDHKGYNPIRFGALPHSAGRLALRIGFAAAADADTFAQVFGGRLVPAVNHPP
jgi:hypothetical protein